MNVEEARKLTKIAKKNKKEKLEEIINHDEIKSNIYKDILNKITEAANQGETSILVDFLLYPLRDKIDMEIVCNKLERDGFNVRPTYETLFQEFPKMIIDWR